jgi:hypothetical protein
VSILNEFKNKYLVLSVEEKRNRYSDYSYQAYYDHNRYAYDPYSESVIELEMRRPGFEQLMHNALEYDRLAYQQRCEEHARRTNPAVADAYDKYQLLLQLMK